MNPAHLRYKCLAAAFALLIVSGCSSDDDSGTSDNSDTKTRSNDVGKAGRAAAGSRATGDTAGTGAITSAGVPTELTTTGPIPLGEKKPFTKTSADLASYGYSEKEFFIEGGASAYSVPGGMTMDGKWKLTETTKAAFKTRLIVRRPIDASKFNGTVVVEWLNVSGGADGDPGFMYNSDMLLREGFAFVGVSAQAQGVVGGGASLGGAGAVPLVQYDPERYGSLKHPGDIYSFDIYSQAAQAIGEPGDVDVLEGLKPERLIGYGESQSASRMVSYVNGVHPLVHRYDGFFIHSRSASSAPYESAGGLGGFGGGAPVFIRDDIDEKVFQFQTETDVTGMLGFLPARQADTDKLRTWEVAGTAHADQFIVDFNASMATAGSGGLSCPGANNGPQYRVIRAALYGLNLWMRDGTAPAKGEVLQTDASRKSPKDEYGNSLGGVRSPDVDVPTRTLTGDPPASTSAGGGFCFLFGSSTPFTPDRLKTLYPTHDEYVAKVKASASKLREAGFLLEPEEKGCVAEAEKAPVPPN